MKLLIERGARVDAKDATYQQTLMVAVRAGHNDVVRLPVEAGADVTIEVQKDRVIIKVDWMDTERVVYLDLCAHPPDTQTFLHGHSVGRWEGRTLVVETTNFREHPMGTSTGVSGSTQKKVIERFSVSDDGKSLLRSKIRSILARAVVRQARMPSGHAAFQPEVGRRDRAPVPHGLESDYARARARSIPVFREMLAYCRKHKETIDAVVVYALTWAANRGLK